MRNAVDLLQQLGFGEYEAKAYTALLQRSPLNGYELAKASGIPRPNVYSVLEKLEERGAVLRVETPGGVRFRPVPPAELTQRLGSRIQTALQAAEASLSDIAQPVEHEYVWNARGYDILLDQARALIDRARERLLIALWPQEAQMLADPLRRAEQRGANVTTLCLTACVNECGGCRGHIYRYDVAAEPQQRWLVLVPDGEEVLMGEIDPTGDALAVRTRQRLTVDLAAWYIGHTIALAAVLADLDGRQDMLLAPETRGILEQLHPTRGGGWLEHMRAMLDRAG